MIIARHKKTINGISPIYDREIVIKYIAYARQKIMPELTDEAGEYIFNQSQELTKLGKTNFSNRLIPRLIKISYACAKVRLSQQVLVQDAEEAVKKLRYSYQLFCDLQVINDLFSAIIFQHPERMTFSFA